MLVNNLQKYREMYSSEKLVLSLSACSLSSSRPANNFSKTERCFGFPRQCLSQKKNADNPIHLQSTPCLVNNKEKDQPFKRDKFIQIYSPRNQKLMSKKGIHYHTEELQIDKKCNKIQDKNVDDYLSQHRKSKANSEIESNKNINPSQRKVEQQKQRIQKIVQNPWIKIQHDTISKQSDNNLKATVETLQSNDKPMMRNEQKTNKVIIEETQLIRSLKFRDLFFCGWCYQYIFGIQKSYHYPECKNKVAEQLINDQDKYCMGLQKLQLLVQLSQYTKNQQRIIKSISQRVFQNQDIKNNQFHQSPRTYYTLHQIQLAANTIINKLIKPYLNNQKLQNNSFVFCNFHCNYQKEF